MAGESDSIYRSNDSMVCSVQDQDDRERNSDSRSGDINSRDNFNAGVWQGVLAS